MDTSASALSRIFHALAQHPKAQEKLRRELLDAMSEHGSELPYDVLSELPYLDAVCRETLRMYVHFLPLLLR